jgi:hypothetical protein
MTTIDHQAGNNSDLAFTAARKMRMQFMTDLWVAAEQEKYNDSVMAGQGSGGGVWSREMTQPDRKRRSAGNDSMDESASNEQAQAQNSQSQSQCNYYMSMQQQHDTNSHSQQLTRIIQHSTNKRQFQYHGADAGSDATMMM